MLTLTNNIRDKTVDEELNKKQVYNISNNIFSYQDARAACKAHGDLATYHQVLDTYKKVVNGVIMDGLKVRWLFIQLKKILGKN